MPYLLNLMLGGSRARHVATAKVQRPSFQNPISIGNDGPFEVETKIVIVIQYVA